MMISRWRTSLFPWAALGDEVDARWLWGFRAAWLVGISMWFSAGHRTPRGLLSLLVLFCLVGQSLGPERGIRCRPLETAAILAFSFLFFNGIVAFSVESLVGLLTEREVAAVAVIWSLSFHATVLVFAVMWWLLLRHQRASKSPFHG